MSTAARKARKKAGIQFEKPAKTATPFFDRDSFKRLPEKQQDAIAAAHGRELTPAIKELLDKLRPPRQNRHVRNYSR